MESLVGKWKVYKSENFDEFLKELEVGMIMRTAAKNINPTHTISVNGNKLTVKAEAGPKTSENSLTLGEESDTKSEQGDEIKSLATFADGVLKVLNTPKDSKKKPVTVERSIQGDDLVMTMTCGKVACKRFFKKV